jgi:hypothetical protein
MFTKTKMALAATLILGSASIALADGSRGAFDVDIYRPTTAQQQNLTGRPVALPRTHVPAAQHRSLRTAPVGLYRQNLNTSPVALPQAPAASDQWMERASQVFDGGAR